MRNMDKKDLITILGFVFFIAAGLGFYAARIIFGG